ncbi:MAG TPA: phosphopantetheine-binding protein [Blastocatellia bacterium]|nr:phosphopantetheine-binding protein [Blastocatellia bacterium]
MPNRDEVFATVKSCLVEALGVSPDAIAPDVSLIGDLEAESIDFLDIVFRLENAFHIEIQRGELFPQEILRDPANVNQGKITEAGVAKLREKFSFTPLAGLTIDTPVTKFTNEMLTVGMIVDYVESKLNQTVGAAESA